MEVDLVAHCGDSARGEYLNSLDMIDVKTRWVELYGLLNRSQATVKAAIITWAAACPTPCAVWSPTTAPSSSTLA